MLEAAPPARILSLRSGRRVCAVPLEHVMEVMRPLPVEPLAGAPAFVAGLAVIRGQATPVLDLDALLGGNSAAIPAASGRFVTLRVANRPIALRVDAVLAIQPLAADRLAALPPLWQGPHPPAVTALGTLDRELLIVLETARLLPGDDPIPTEPPEAA